MLELYQKGYVKGTVTTSMGNEATAIGMSLPLRPGRDVLSLLHRDFGAHLLLGSTPYQLLCQYLANAESPTHACEGNVHHGDAASRRFPMISHLGKMLSLVVGGTWAARRNDEQVFGLAVIGDGGTSTGEFHESLNIASVHKVPVLFLIENNHYAFSTPTSVQYNCRRLSDRAIGYGISGRTIDGTDPWTVYSTVCEALDDMQASSLPVLLECETLRLCGHAAYDKGHYIPAELMERWRKHDPLVQTQRRLAEVCGFTESSIADIEEAIETEVHDAVSRALAVGRPRVPQQWPVHAKAAISAEDDNNDSRDESGTLEAAIEAVPFRRPAPRPVLKPFKAKGVKNGDAVNMALDYLLANRPSAFLAGMDVGVYGSAFKTCKGLVERYGADRVIDMPLAESSILGFALGASQIGAEPIIEFQFADFSTEAVTQLGLNAGTWHFRTGCAAPMLVRLPCGGGLTVGAFHSGEFEGLWSRFPGLKLIYPATPQETYEALLAGFHDPNPCLVFEHKLLYWSRSGDIDFDGDLKAVWRPQTLYGRNRSDPRRLGRHGPSLAGRGVPIGLWRRGLEPVGLATAGDRAHRRVGQEDGPVVGRAGIGRDPGFGRPPRVAADARVLPVAEGGAGTDRHARRAGPLRPRIRDGLHTQSGEDSQSDYGDFGDRAVAKSRMKLYNTACGSVSGTSARSSRTL